MMAKGLLRLLVLGLAVLSFVQQSNGGEAVVTSDTDASFWLAVAVRLEALGQPQAAREALVVARRLDNELGGVNESMLRLDMTKCPRQRSEAADRPEECGWWWDDGSSYAEHEISSGGDDSKKWHGLVSVTRVDYGDCSSLLAPPEDGVLGISFSLDSSADHSMMGFGEEWTNVVSSGTALKTVGGVLNPRAITDPDEVDIVALEGCEKVGEVDRSHGTHFTCRCRGWRRGAVELGSIFTCAPKSNTRIHELYQEPTFSVQGTDPFLSARLFCRFESLPPSALLPLYSIIVARNAAQSLRALNPRAPPWDIPAHLLDAFTMDGAIEVTKHYVDESAAEARDNYNFGFYAASRAEIERMVNDVNQRKRGYYGETDDFLYSSLDAAGGLQGSTVVIMGSLEPWYEAVCLAFGAESCSTIEYNQLHFDHPRLRTYQSEQFFALQDRPTFDVGFSISSFEHDGLGRYGDELDPEGDFRAMHDMESIIRPDGLLYLAVPVGRDLVKWNAHRKYGRRRLAALVSNWTLVSHAGLTPHRLDDPSPDTHFQPVLVLKNRRPSSTIDWDVVLSA